jgi:tetratricopeptide (TPR) repeat protein
MNYPEFDASWLDYHAASEAVQQGHYGKASKILRQAILDSQITGVIDPKLVLTANTLAERYFEEGHYAAAAALYRSVLDVRTKILGDAHPDVRETRRQLAAALWNAGGMTPKLVAAQQ